MDTSNRPFWERFLDLYRQHACLWDNKCKDYNNKMKRNESYKILLNRLQEVIPGATLETLKKKINNIRTSFRRELRKVQESKVPGATCIYEPTLWYFNSLLFIAQSEEERKDKSDDDDDYVHDLVDANDLNFLNIEVKQEEASAIELNSPDDLKVLSENQEEIPQNVYGSTSFPASNANLHRKRRHITTKFNSLKQRKLHFNSAPKTNDEDEFLITGKKFAFQLKKMDDHQRLIAEKLISDVMFFGGMGKLTFDTVIQFPSGHAHQGICYSNSNNTF